MMACFSSECKRQSKCAHHICNPRETDGLENVEDYYWFGTCSLSSDGCEERWWCGPHGNWGMFKPVNVELLKERRDTLDRLIKELECGDFD